MRPQQAAPAQRGTEEADGEEMTRAADDFGEIAKRWKEIREQNDRRIAGTPETSGTTPATPATPTGGGFVTPDGKPYNAIPEGYLG
jgi:hypothetical protein